MKVSYELFNWNLMLFVVAVGLLSAEDIVLVVKRYGMKFVVLGLVVTGVGALCTYGMARMAVGVDPLLVAGTYTGALTSSPGLGAALEATGGNPLVTVGYTIAYPFGVLAVVLFVQLAPAIFRIDLKREREELAAIYGISTASPDGRGPPCRIGPFLRAFLRHLRGPGDSPG